MIGHVLNVAHVKHALSMHLIHIDTFTVCEEETKFFTQCVQPSQASLQQGAEDFYILPNCLIRGGQEHMGEAKMLTQLKPNLSGKLFILARFVGLWFCSWFLFFIFWNSGLNIWT